MALVQWCCGFIFSSGRVDLSKFQRTARAKEPVCTGGSPPPPGRKGGSRFSRDRSVGSKTTSFEALKTAYRYLV